MAARPGTKGPSSGYTRTAGPKPGVGVASAGASPQEAMVGQVPPAQKQQQQQQQQPPQQPPQQQPPAPQNSEAPPTQQQGAAPAATPAGPSGLNPSATPHHYGHHHHHHHHHHHGHHHAHHHGHHHLQHQAFEFTGNVGGGAGAMNYGPSSYNAPLPVLHPSLPEQIWVLDPLTRKLKVPTKEIVATAATATLGTTPSLCLAFLENRCRHPWCRQAHIPLEVVQRLRQEAQDAPTCCHMHGAPQDVTFLTSRFQAVEIGFHNGTKVSVPTERLAVTVGLQRHLAQVVPKTKTGPSFEVSSRMVCRLHLGHRCRYLEDCNNLHVCREFDAVQKAFSETGNDRSGNNANGNQGGSSGSQPSGGQQQQQRNAGARQQGGHQQNQPQGRNGMHAPPPPPPQVNHHHHHHHHHHQHHHTQSPPPQGLHHQHQQHQQQQQQPVQSPTTHQPYQQQHQHNQMLFHMANQPMPPRTVLSQPQAIPVASPPMSSHAPTPGGRTPTPLAGGSPMAAGAAMPPPKYADPNASTNRSPPFGGLVPPSPMVTPQSSFAANPGASPYSSAALGELTSASAGTSVLHNGRTYSVQAVRSSAVTDSEFAKIAEANQTIFGAGKIEVVDVVASPANGPAVSPFGMSLGKGGSPAPAAASPPADTTTAKAWGSLGTPVADSMGGSPHAALPPAMGSLSALPPPAGAIGQQGKKKPSGETDQWSNQTTPQRNRVDGSDAVPKTAKPAAGAWGERKLDLSATVDKATKLAPKK